MSRCRKCQAEIRFCKTASGKWTPVDTEPNLDGNLYLGHDVVGIPMVKPVDLFTPADAVRVMPHWATCTDPDSFRDKSTK